MSTKSTLRNGPQHHLYEEAFDDGAVFLSLEGCDFSAEPNHVTVRIPLAVWEHIRDATIASFDLAALSDEDLDKFVRAKWQERQQRIAESTQPAFAKAFGCLIWRGDTPSAELANGFEWYSDERSRQRVLRDEIEKLQRQGSK